MKRKTKFLVVVAALVACAAEPVPIRYGTDVCHFCKMTIVDNQHAAELVTVKGKAFKYDAIECMMNQLKNWEHSQVKYYLVADYSNPGKLIAASEAYYAITESIPSPMGAFLTAFGEEAARDQVINPSKGERLEWLSLKLKFQVLSRADESE